MKNLKMKKTLVFLLMVSMFVGLFSACGKDDEQKKGKNAQTETTREKLIVGFDAEFPPYGYKDENGEYVGFDLDLAAEVCEINGWELVKQPIDWNSKDMELNSGTIDCIWNGFTINGRETEYTWSKAYVDNSQVVIVRSDSGIDSLSDLENKVVIVQADSSALAAFTGEDATEENKALCESFKELHQVADYNSAFMNLESGVADAVCLDIGVANYQLESRDGIFKMLEARVSSEQYGIGFKLGNTGLRDQVQTALDKMLKDGSFEKIAEKWGLSDSVCLGEEGTDYAYSLSVSDSDNNVGTDDKSAKGKESLIERAMDIIKQLAKGMLASLAIFVLTLLFSVPLGLLVCMIRMSRFKVLQWIARFYISVLRGTPLMLQLLVVFFGPYYVFDVTLSSSYRFYAVIIGFTLNYAAYFAEIYRAGIESIPAGQYEAASVLGMTRTQTFWKIIFPQMVKRVIPPVTNEVITLVKDTSLAFALAYTEMFTLAKQVAAAEASIMPLFVAGVFYYVFNFIVAMIMEFVEKKLQYYK